MPRFPSDPQRPESLVASIAALAAQTGLVTLIGTVETARAHAAGGAEATVEHVSRLAVGAGIAAREIAWLVSELEAAGPNPEQRAAAVAAVSGLATVLGTAGAAVETLGDRGAPTEAAAAAEALRRVAAQLGALLGLLER